MATPYEAEQPESSLFDSMTVLLWAMVGAAAGYAATMLSRGQRPAQPAVAMLGVGGQMQISREEAAKQAWLARLDAPTWGSAATTLANVASQAAYMAGMEQACDQGNDVACDELSREEEAKRAWLASLDTPTWGPASSAKMSEEAAKKAWLASLDQPSWVSAARASANVASEAAYMAQMEEACYTGDDVACDELSREEEAKRAWLAKLDSHWQPAWGPNAKLSEEAAKRKWLASLDAPSWGKAATTLANIAAEAAHMQMMEVACDEGDDVACDELSREEEAKRKWLASLDVPTWGAAAAAVSAVATQVN
jgi:hypothetical protein